MLLMAPPAVIDWLRSKADTDPTLRPAWIVPNDPACTARKSRPACTFPTIHTLLNGSTH